MIEQWVKERYVTPLRPPSHQKERAAHLTTNPTWTFPNSLHIHGNCSLRVVQTRDHQCRLRVPPFRRHAPPPSSRWRWSIRLLLGDAARHEFSCTGSSNHESESRFWIRLQGFSGEVLGGEIEFGTCLWFPVHALFLRVAIAFVRDDTSGWVSL